MFRKWRIDAKARGWAGTRPQTKNRRLQIHDLHAVHWNVRGKTVQEVLDTMQDIIHAPDFLLLQEVGGLGKADASVVQGSYCSME